MKEFAANNFKSDENDRKFSRVETLWEKEKLLVTSNFSFSHCVFKRLVQQTHKNQGLFGKGLMMDMCKNSLWLGKSVVLKKEVT